MKAVLCLCYLVTGFFMFALHASSLDAPTLVFHEYSENFILRKGSKASAQQMLGVASVKTYLLDHMKDLPEFKAERLSRLIVRLSREHNIPARLILSVMKVESNFQPWAVSPKGALGLMQLMPETGAWVAARYGMRWDGPATLLDEEMNTIMGVRYLSYLKDKYSGDLRKMLSAYNRGPAAVDLDVSNGRNFTTDYYKKIKEYLPKFAAREQKQS